MKERVVIKLKKLQNLNCIDRLKPIIEGIEGVFDIKNNIEDNIIIIDYDSTKTKSSKILIAIEDNGCIVIDKKVIL